ncbi:hypothetical protein HMPREF0813_00022 [Streptococcus anginosus F0211]|uniref:Uncharacterized protein n=1 Tax=Streptococcus anginosus F0211 TaxID=706437 RepID=E6IYG0_STRAP|nr:hypothetical protein HMPREF0813_00022 [Streptococcus anginosus F0211]
MSQSCQSTVQEWETNSFRFFPTPFSLKKRRKSKIFTQKSYEDML